MEDEIVRTQDEVDSVLNRAVDGRNFGSVYPGMSYEDGILNLYDWLVGRTEDHPFD